MARSESDDRKTITGDKVEELMFTFKSKLDNENVANFTEEQLAEEINCMWKTWQSEKYRSRGS